MRVERGVRIRRPITVSLLLTAAAACPGAVTPATARPAQPRLTGAIFTVAGALRWTGPSDESRLATATSFSPSAVTAAPGGGFLVLDTNQESVLRVFPDGGVSTVLSSSQPSPGAAFVTRLNTEGAANIAALPHGGFLLADSGNNQVLEVTSDGGVSTVAGNGQFGYGGDGGPATEAELKNPEGIAVLPDGGFLIADTYNNRVRRVWPDGHISTVAGGRQGFRGDGGPATSAALDEPEAVAAMPGGGFLIADNLNCRVRRVWPDGHISTIAGNGQDRSTGDGGPARSAAIGFVDSLAVLPNSGFVVGSDEDVRQVTPKGTISTIASGNPSGLPGDGGPEDEAQLYGPPDSIDPSVAALPDGGILIGYGSTVRLVVGAHRPRLLAAAMRPLSGVASSQEYRASVVLTRPARLTLRVYRSMTGRPLVTTRVRRPAGESTVVVKLGRRVTPGLYAIDLRAQDATQTTRAELYVYLGGAVTTRSIHSVVGGLIADEYSNNPNAVISVERCYKFSSTRVDCSILGDDSYVQTVWLTPQGQLSSRTYEAPIRHHRRVFELNPQWNGPAVWDDLGGAWSPFQFTY